MHIALARMGMQDHSSFVSSLQAGPSEIWGCIGGISVLVLAQASCVAKQ